MTNTNYFSVDDGNGNQLTTGLQGRDNARKVAQRMADERGEPVYLYQPVLDGSDTEAESEEIAPKLTAETITDAQIEALRDEAAQHGDQPMVDTCEIALHGNDPEVTLVSMADAKALCAQAINAARAMVD